MKKLLCVVLCILVLTGCAAPKEAAPQQTVSETPKEQTKVETVTTELSYCTYLASHADFYNTIADMWNAENSENHVKLNVTVLEEEDYQTQLLSLLSSADSAPDFVDFPFNDFAAYASQLQSLDDLLQGKEDTLVKARCLKNADTYCGLGYDAGAVVMFYQTELCKRAGIDWQAIKTWDQFEEAAETFQDAFPEGTFTTYETNTLNQVLPQLISQGADFTDQYGNTTLNTPALTKVLEYSQSMVENGYAMIAPKEGNEAAKIRNMMQEGRLCAVMMPVSYFNTVAGNGFAVSPLPVWEEGQGRSAVVGGTAVGIPTAAKSAKLIKEFLSYALISPEGAVKELEMLGYCPVFTPIWELLEAQPSANQNSFSNNPFTVLASIKNELLTFSQYESAYRGRVKLLEGKVLESSLKGLDSPSNLLASAQDELSKSKTTIKEE